MIQKINPVSRRLFINLLPEHKNCVLYYNLFFRYKLFLDSMLSNFLNKYNIALLNFYLGYYKKHFYLNLFFFKKLKKFFLLKKQIKLIFLKNFSFLKLESSFFFKRLYLLKLNNFFFINRACSFNSSNFSLFFYNTKRVKKFNAFLSRFNFKKTIFPPKAIKGWAKRFFHIKSRNKRAARGNKKKIIVSKSKFKKGTNKYKAQKDINTNMCQQKPSTNKLQKVVVNTNMPQKINNKQNWWKKKKLWNKKRWFCMKKNKKKFKEKRREAQRRGAKKKKRKSKRHKLLQRKILQVNNICSSKLLFNKNIKKMRLKRYFLNRWCKPKARIRPFFLPIYVKGSFLFYFYVTNFYVFSNYFSCDYKKNKRSLVKKKIELTKRLKTKQTQSLISSNFNYKKKHKNNKQSFLIKNFFKIKQAPSLIFSNFNYKTKFKKKYKKKYFKRKFKTFCTKVFNYSFLFLQKNYFFFCFNPFKVYEKAYQKFNLFKSEHKKILRGKIKKYIFLRKIKFALLRSRRKKAKRWSNKKFSKFLFAIKLKNIKFFSISCLQALKYILFSLHLKVLKNEILLLFNYSKIIFECFFLDLLVFFFRVKKQNIYIRAFLVNMPARTNGLIAKKFNYLLFVLKSNCNFFFKKYLIKKIDYSVRYLKLKLVARNLGKILSGFLRKKFNISLFNGFTILNKFNKFEFFLNCFRLKKFFIFSYTQGHQLQKNKKFIWNIEFLTVFFLSLKIKQFGTLNFFICNKIGVLKEQWACVRELKNAIRTMKLNTFNFFGVHILLTGTIGGRQRSTRFHIFKAVQPAGEDLNLEIYYTYNQSISIHGVLGVKQWFYY